MRRIRWIGLVGLVMAIPVALSIGTRPPLKAQQPVSLMATSFVGGAFGRDDDPAPVRVYLPAPPMTIAETKTRLKLHDKISMNFPNDTPLQDVVAYIEQSTIDKVDFPEGISIYVDPQGLQDADKTTASTVLINLKNLPLETTLELLLKQLGLTYWVNKDGLLIITAASDDLVTPVTLDREILSNISSLRSEIQALRSEVKTLRRGAGEDHPAPATTPAAAGGSMGGGFR